MGNSTGQATRFFHKKRKRKNGRSDFRLRETSNVNHIQQVDGPCLTHDSNQLIIKKENQTIREIWTMKILRSCSLFYCNTSNTVMLLKSLYKYRTTWMNLTMLSKIAKHKRTHIVLLHFLKVQNQVKLNCIARSLHWGRNTNWSLGGAWGSIWGSRNSKSWVSGSYNGIHFVVIHWTINLCFMFFSVHVLYFTNS